MDGSTISRLAAVWLAGLAPLAGTASAQDMQPTSSSPTAPNRAAPKPHRLQQRFDAANTSHDGRLTLLQAQAGGMRMVARHFDIIDVGHKGFVTLEDIRQFSRARRAARQDRMPGADANSQEDQ